MRCSRCQKWELGFADVFCSWCAAKVRELKVSLDPSNFIAGYLPTEATLTLENNSSTGTIRLAGVESDQQWVEIDDSLSLGTELNRGDVAKLAVKVDTYELADEFQPATITVKTEADGEWTADLTVSPKPSWDVDAQLPPLYLDDQQKEVSLPVRLLVEKGTLSVIGVEPKNNGWAKVDLTGIPKTDLALDSRSRKSCEFPLVVETDKLPRDEAGRLLGEYEVELQFKFAELAADRTQTVRFNCMVPPRLEVTGQANARLTAEVFSRESADLTLHLQNGFLGETGRAAVSITSAAADKHWLQLNTDLPLKIESGKSERLKFLVEADRVGASEDKASLVLEFDPPEKERRKIALTVFVKVKDKPEYEGWLCIDFGTTNTCIGRSDLDKDGRPVLLDIDISHANNMKVASSVVQYINSVGGKRECLVGREAYLNLLKPMSAGTVFDQVKRKLGRPEKWTVHFTNDESKLEELTAREIATDIFRELLKYSERELKAKPIRCAISHPSRFSQRQLDDLRSALRDAFKPYEIPDESIKLYHEPIAAAVDYLTTQSEPKAEEKDYFLLVYDFGGGTTDFALIRIQETVHQKRGRITKPEVLRADGDPALGGEDVTDMMMSLYGEKIQLRAQSLYPKVAPEDLRFPLDAAAESDLFLQKIAQENRVRLRQWTENQKLLLAGEMIEGKRGGIESPLPFELTHIINGNPVKDATAGLIVEFTNAEFNEILSEMIEPSLEKLAQLPGKAGVRADQISLVLLSGQSSALPLVKEKIESRFKNATVRQLNNLKECVVRGLCALQSDELSSGVVVRVAMQGCLSTTTSRLGFRVTESGRHRFKQVVGVGQPIDKDGYSCEVQGVNYKRATTLPLYEHMGSETDDSFSETDPRIRVVKLFRISDKLAEMGEAGKRVTDDVLFDSELWFTVKPNQQIELEIRFKEEENLAPIKFEATYTGY